MNNHEIYYVIEDEKRLFIVFDINGINYEITVYHYNDKYTIEQILEEIVEYVEIQYNELKYEFPGIVSLV